MITELPKLSRVRIAVRGGKLQERGRSRYPRQETIKSDSGVTRSKKQATWGKP